MAAWFSAEDAEEEVGDLDAGRGHGAEAWDEEEADEEEDLTRLYVPNEQKWQAHLAALGKQGRATLNAVRRVQQHLQLKQHPHEEPAGLAAVAGDSLCPPVVLPVHAAPELAAPRSPAPERAQPLPASRSEPHLTLRGISADSVTSFSSQPGAGTSADLSSLLSPSEKHRRAQGEELLEKRLFDLTTPGVSRVTSVAFVSSLCRLDKKEKSEKVEGAGELEREALSHQLALALLLEPRGSSVDRPETDQQQVLHQLDTVCSLARCCVRPWRHLLPEQIKATCLSGGLSNKLFVVDADVGGELREGGAGDRSASESGRLSEDRRGEETPKRVLLRVYGHPAGTELFDPRAEQKLFKKLGDIGVAPRCIAEFDGGRVEAWIDGRTLKTEDLHDEDTLLKIARVLSRFHQTCLRPLRRCASETARRSCPWCAVVPLAATSLPLRSRPSASLHRFQSPSGESVQDALSLSPHTHHHSSSAAPSAARRDPPPAGAPSAPSQAALPASPSGSADGGFDPAKPAGSCPLSGECSDSKSAAPFSPCECLLCRTELWALLAEKSQREAALLAQQTAEVAEAALEEAAEAAAAKGEEKRERADQAQGRPAAERLRAEAEPAATPDGAADHAEAARHRSGEETPGSETEGREGQDASGEDETEAIRAAELLAEKAAVALDEAKATVGLMQGLDLEKYMREARQLREAILSRVRRELSPESLTSVYSGAERWALLSAASPVLSHNDLQENNLMLANAGRLHLIDFEYATESLRGFDIANLFCEMCIDYTSAQHFPFFLIDSTRYPARATRRKFIRVYLESLLAVPKRRRSAADAESRARGDAKEGASSSAALACVNGVGGERDGDATHDEVNDAIITNFEHMVELLTLSSHLLWAFWSVVRTPMRQSEDEFSYLRYAVERLKLYEEKKTELIRLGILTAGADGRPSASA
ncbi:phosphotransferase enzyme family protein [Besnoitia besnoiti]|uniref:Phosphotransferase enzyme family protein n=1 Tax=Besnoitia besnoiti TaxID=94643 RepID=A0A2A9MDQ9_BESBE|nr:phosphotransferase enzyme family protein [Besnoitia besnoiti]PFH36638.1 phosphotransferase enzyme family protein [Besnoitia besnoiti]